MGLEGKGAVVTGAGQGIGAAVARALAKAGAAVVVAARSKERIEGVAGALRSDGHAAWAVSCDVRNPESVRAMARQAQLHLDGVDILVNNAGMAHSASLQKTSLEEWDGLFAVNATGTFLCTQAFFPGMVERRWGRVVNIASTAGLQGARYIAAYAASKHAVIGFTRCIAAEAAMAGVTVNAVCPGYVDTEMTGASVRRIMEKTGKNHAEAMDAILQTTPQRRLIRPEEVAHAVLALCDENAEGINGQAIVIDGGGLLGR